MAARLDFVAAESAAKGTAPIRLSLAGAEAITNETAPVRQSYACLEAAAKGDAPLRLAYLVIESLVPVGSPPTVSTEKFPLSPGLTWSVHVAPKFTTRVASHVSGREIRTAWQQYAIYDLTLSFDFLRGDN